MKISFKKFSSRGHVPTKATPGSACYGVYSSTDITITPGGTEKIPLILVLSFRRNASVEFIPDQACLFCRLFLVIE